MAAPNPRKKARAAKPLHSSAVRKRTKRASPARPSRSPGTSVPIPPTRQARSEAFQASWEPTFASLEVIERFAVGEIGVAIYRSRTPRPHWLFVTTGLWDRGVELCLKVPQRPEDVSPPPWASSAFRMLVGLALSPEGPPLTSAQVLTVEAPFATGSDMTTFAFTSESGFEKVVTPYDSVHPLLAVGLTRDEERIVREWSPSALLELLAQADPLLATDPERSSLLLSPRARTLIEQRLEREGSSLAVMWASRSSVLPRAQGSTWTLSTEAVETFVSLLKGRVGHNRGFAVHTAGSPTVEIAPADHPSLAVTDVATRLELSQTAARALRAVLRPRPGQYAIDTLPELTIEVV